MKKITRYLSGIKDNGKIRNELEDARDNGTLADYLKKQDVALSDEELELISGGQRGGMGNDDFADARRRESGKGEVIKRDYKDRPIQWDNGSEIYHYECLSCHHWLYEGFWAWYCENCDDEAYYKSINKCKVIDRSK